MQFIREYTNKVDDLVKDRIESQKEEKAKENEEKELVAQQVILKFPPSVWLNDLLLFILKQPS